MRQIAAGQFKQTCLKLLEDVRQTREPIVITKRGVPVAQLVPLPVESDWRGAMAGTGVIHGDLLMPATDPEEWEALRD